MTTLREQRIGIDGVEFDGNGAEVLCASVAGFGRARRQIRLAPLLDLSLGGALAFYVAIGS